ncbi:MAG TPA: hypothetical protein VGQ53_14455, partial [Chitinophagaceae bacterium]|nr:hypothetical protein [Chitinophagaceae bacterium]
FIIARGSDTETMENLATAFDESYITSEELTAGEQKCELVFKLTNGYISYPHRPNASKDNAIKTPNFQFQTPKS